jgi:hypothetical protein
MTTDIFLRFFSIYIFFHADYTKVVNKIFDKASGDDIDQC